MMPSTKDGLGQEIFSLGKLDDFSSIEQAIGALPPELLEDNSWGLKCAFPGQSAGEIKLLTRKVVACRSWANEVQRRLCAASRETLLAAVEQVEVTGEHHVLEKIKSKTPIMFVSPHYGLYLLGSLFIARRFGEIPQLALLSPGWLNASVGPSLRALQTIDPAFGVAYNDSRGTMKVIRHLKKCGAVTLLYDQLISFGSNLYVPMFGRLIKVMAGAGFLAQKTDSVLIPYFCYPKANTTIAIEFCRPIAGSDALGSSREEEVSAELSFALFSELEKQLLSVPEYWHCWHELKGRMVEGFVLPKSRRSLLGGLDEVANRFPLDPKLSKVTECWKGFLTKERSQLTAT